VGGVRLSPQAMWRLGPEEPALPEGDVHVWRASLHLPPDERESLYRILDPAERERVARLPSLSTRDRTMARAILRMILGRYLGLDPTSLKFSYNPSGKPELAAPYDSSGLCFNLSHSHGVAVYAVARRRAVGIDLERVREGVPVERIARRFFSPREIAALEGIAEAARRRAFFTCWTRKEAYVKARGIGLFPSFRRFTVSLAPGEPACLLDVEGDAQEPLRWTFREFVPAPGYVASLAVEGRGFRVRYWDWSGGRS